MAETAGFLIPIAAITMMLWLLWSDSIRNRPMPRLWYLFRALLYLAIAAVMIYNAWRYGESFAAWNYAVIGTAVVVGVIGAIWFGRKGQSRTP